MTTMAEPEWDEQTRALVLGLAAYEAGLCPLCHRPVSVCQAAENQDRFVAPDPVRCHASTALLAKQAGYSEDRNPQMRALLFHTQLIGKEDGRG